MSFYGTEVIDAPSKPTFREVDGAIAVVVGAADVGTLHGAEADKYVNKLIPIRSREDAAQFGVAQDGFDLPAQLDAIFDQDKGQGCGTIFAVNIFDPATHSSPDDLTASDVLGAIDPLGNKTGLQLCYDVYNSIGALPKFIGVGTRAAMTGVRAELQVLANKLGARAFIDAPFGVGANQVIAARGPDGDFDFQISSRRLNLAWPAVRVADASQASGERLDSYGTRLMGVALSNLVEQGPGRGISNTEIAGIESMEAAVDYIPGDATGITHALRAAGIITARTGYGSGPRVEGTESSAWPSDTDPRAQYHVQLIFDLMRDEILQYLDQFKDLPATPERISYFEKVINDKIAQRSLGERRWFYGGSFSFNREKTTTDGVATIGQFYFTLSLSPIALLKRMTVEMELDFSFLQAALGLQS